MKNKLHFVYKIYTLTQKDYALDCEVVEMEFSEWATNLCAKLTVCLIVWSKRRGSTKCFVSFVSVNEHRPRN